VIVDALSRRYTMLSQLHHKIFGLETIKGLYADDFDFKDAFKNCREGRPWQKNMLCEGLLYRANKLCVCQLAPFAFYSCRKCMGVA
jgi:hypothetical protein